MATQVTVNRVPDYSDLDLDFMMNPKTHQLIIKTGNEAIKRSVRNLVMTNFYDRPFQSYIGSDVRSLLFENATPFTAVLLQDAITLCLQNFEPRVKVKEVVVSEDIDNHGYNARIEYIVLNKELPVLQTIFLERIR